MRYIGFDIEGKPTTFYKDNCINTHGAQDIIIENNLIDQVAANNGDGNAILLDFAVSYENVCENVTIRGNIVTGATRGGTANTSAIRVYRGKNSIIENNVCYGNKAGVSIASSYSTNIKVYNNTLDNNDFGIYMESAGSHDYRNNIITNNKVGLRTYDGNSWDYNLFYGNGQNYTSRTPGAH